MNKKQEMFRTILTIKRIGESSATCMMGAWNPHEEVEFPLDIIPKEMTFYVKPGNMILAHVNLDAENKEDLRFENFELPNMDICDIIDDMNHIVIPPKELSDSEIYDIAMSFRHDFGLTVSEEYRKIDVFSSGMTQKERELLVSDIKEFYRLIRRTLISNHKK